MPIKWWIDPPVVHFESDASPTFKEWQLAIEAALRSNKYQPGYRVVHDVRSMRRVPSVSEAQQRASFVAEQAVFRGVGRWAVVAKDDHQYGMARLSSYYVQAALPFGVFRDMLDAIPWVLGA